MKKQVLTLAMIFAFALSFAGSVVFTSQPALSPCGTDIYFSYNGDIYKASTEGGLALRVISMGGTESYPKISPDGQYLAFSSNEQGNNNVYVVPVKGGEIRQLTFHDASDVPVSWSPDSKNIYFESNRYNTISAYSVPLQGGTPKRLFSHYFNTIANLVQNPVTGEFYFNESTESFRFATRKGYKGDHNPDIKSYNPLTNEFKILTEYKGKDIWPMVDSAGVLYYVSDEINGEANIVRHSDGKYLTEFTESVQYPSISFDGSKIVFVKGYKIHILCTSTGTVSLPEITTGDLRTRFNISAEVGRPDAFAVSPDGKKIAFVSRGFLFVSDSQGNFVNRLDTPADERVEDVLWDKESRRVYYTRTDSGRRALYSQNADILNNIGVNSEELHYNPNSSVRYLTSSSDNSLIAFVEGGKSVMLFDTKTGDIKKLSDHEFWAFQSYRLAFSADDRYLAYTAVNLFERDIFVYDLKNSKVINITNSANFENDPYFSACGKYLYFAANRTNSAFPRGTNSQLYRVSLAKLPSPFATDKFKSLFDDKEDNPTPLADIDVSDIQRRYSRVLRSGDQTSPFVFDVSGKSYLFFNSNHEGTWGLYVQEIKDWDQKPPQRVKGVGLVQAFSQSKKELFVADREAIYSVNPAAATATKTEIKHSFEKNIREEFSQMFYEVWAALDQHFYDVSFHGVDWLQKREYYAAFLPYVRTRDNLRWMINDMLNELNSSHMGFSTFGNDEIPGGRYYTASSGILFSNSDPYSVDRIVSGSVADYSDNRVKSGDRLVAVNGQRVSPEVNREYYFAFAALPNEMILTFSRDGGEFDIITHTCSTSDLRSLLYTEWEDFNREKTEELTGGRVAYVHMRDMSPASLEQFIIDLNTYAVHKDALIFDLRFNNGGNVHKEVLDLLSQREHFRWSHRDNEKVSHPNVVPGSKPLVVLINERSLSDAEVTSNGIKALSMATLIGTETYRWIIFTSSARLVDGSSVRLPAWGCYTLDGKNMEFEGVSPDIYIMNTFEDRLLMRDPQLERAVEEVMKRIITFAP